MMLWCIIVSETTVYLKNKVLNMFINISSCFIRVVSLSIFCRVKGGNIRVFSVLIRV